MFRSALALGCRPGSVTGGAGASPRQADKSAHSTREARAEEARAQEAPA